MRNKSNSCFLSEIVIVVFMLFFNKEEISYKDDDFCNGRIIIFDELFLFEEFNVTNKTIIRIINDMDDIDIITIALL